jgi:hypothetical protein
LCAVRLEASKLWTVGAASIILCTDTCLFRINWPLAINLPPSSRSGSDQGVEIETAASQRLVRWNSMMEVVATGDTSSSVGLTVHRRDLGESDMAAINSLVDEY